MKKILAIIAAAVLLTGAAISETVAEWAFVTAFDQASNSTGASVPAFGNGDEMGPFVRLRSGLQPLVPLHVDQVMVSLLEVSDLGNSFDDDPLSVPFLQFQINTGFKTEGYLAEPQDAFSHDALSGEAAVGTTSTVMFVGIGLDFGAGFLKGNAFVGKPLDTFTSTLSGARNPGGGDEEPFDADAIGFEASAGYQVTDKVALGAGIGHLKNSNDEAGAAGEIWAVYAQAVLNLAPGVQIVPEVGQIDLQNDKQDTDEGDAFYAGAKWEINF